MKKDKVPCPFKSVLQLIPAFLLVWLIYGCSSGSSGSVESKTASLGTSVKNVQLNAGVPKQIKFTYTVPGDISSRGDYSINLTKTLENMTLSSSPLASNAGKFETMRLLAYGLVKEAFAADTAQITAYISYAGDPNVCSSPHVFGPYSIMGAVGSALTSSTATVQPTQAAVDIANLGSFDICIVTTPPIDAYITLTGVAVDFESCAPPAVDIVGNWSGTYQCNNFDGVPESGAVVLDITKNTDGSFHYVDDGGAEFDGHFCGNKFKFKGGKAGAYTESGTLVVNGNDATKTSNWQSMLSDNGGQCSDNLHKN